MSGRMQHTKFLGVYFKENFQIVSGKEMLVVWYGDLLRYYYA